MNGKPWGVAIYIMALSLLSALAVYIGPETYRIDITSDHVAAAPQGRVVTA